MRDADECNETQLRCFQEKRMTLLPTRLLAHALSSAFADDTFRSKKF
jgi:hypothetical protein